MQSGCAECVWDIYRRDLLNYEKAQAIATGQPEPVDPFEEMERRLYGDKASNEVKK